MTSKVGFVWFFCVFGEGGGGGREKVVGLFVCFFVVRGGFIIRIHLDCNNLANTLMSEENFLTKQLCK